MITTDTEQTVEAHEWECKTCHYFQRLEIGPLVVEGRVCNTCQQPVNYNGIKRFLRSELGVIETR